MREERKELPKWRTRSMGELGFPLPRIVQSFLVASLVLCARLPLCWSSEHLTQARNGAKKLLGGDKMNPAKLGMGMHHLRTSPRRCKPPAVNSGPPPPPLAKIWMNLLTNAFARSRFLSDLMHLNNKFRYIACFDDADSLGSYKDAYSVR